MRVGVIVAWPPGAAATTFAAPDLSVWLPPPLGRGRPRCAPDRAGWPLGPPDLVAEVAEGRWPAGARADFARRALALGVRAVWLVHYPSPGQRLAAEVYRAAGGGTGGGTEYRRLGADDHLEDDRLLPGLRVRVADLWRG